MKIRFNSGSETYLERSISYVAIDESAIEVVTEEGTFFITSQYRKLEDRETMVALEKYNDSDDLEKEIPPVEVRNLKLKELEVWIMINKTWERVNLADDFQGFGN